MGKTKKGPDECQNPFVIVVGDERLELPTPSV